jgi:hypothetical protein
MLISVHLIHIRVRSYDEMHRLFAALRRVAKCFAGKQTTFFIPVSYNPSDMKIVFKNFQKF